MWKAGFWWAVLGIFNSCGVRQWWGEKELKIFEKIISSCGEEEEEENHEFNRILIQIPHCEKHGRRRRIQQIFILFSLSLSHSIGISDFAISVFSRVFHFSLSLSLSVSLWARWRFFGLPRARLPKSPCLLKFDAHVLAPPPCNRVVFRVVWMTWHDLGTLENVTEQMTNHIVCFDFTKVPYVITN